MKTIGPEECERRIAVATAALQEQVEALASERDELKGDLKQRNSFISSLQSELVQSRDEVNGWIQRSNSTSERLTAERERSAALAKALQWCAIWMVDNHYTVAAQVAQEALAAHARP